MSLLPRMRFTGRARSRRRRFSFEPLEHRLLLDVGTAELTDDWFDVRQNGAAQLLDVLANDLFGEGYPGEQRITSVSYGSEGGRVDIAEDGRAIRYAPPADFFGTETFVYYVDNLLSATVSAAVASPLEFDQYEFVPDGQPRVLEVLANDPFWPGYEGPKEITSISQTSLGSDVAIADDGKSVVYTPAIDACGKDAFVYIVDDLYPAQVKIEIPNPLEDDRYPDIVQKSENNVLDLLANDPFWPGYPGARAITLVTEPTSGGTVTIADDGQTVVYAPGPDFVGSDRFTYVVDSLYEEFVTLQVHRPVRDDSFEVDTNSTNYPFMVTANDVYSFWEDGHRITRDVIDQVTWVGETEQGGTVEITADGQGVLYSAPADFEGADTFEYIADGKHQATVEVHVTRPVRDDDIRTGVYEDTVENVLDVLKNDFKGDGYPGAGIITAVSETSEGAVVTIADDGRWLVYTPPAGFRGVDTLSYTVDDELVAEVQVLVGSLAVANSYRYDPNPWTTEYVLRVLGNDHFGSNYPGPGVITAVSETANGGLVTISEGGGSLRFVPAEGGADSFTYTVDDKYTASVSVSFKSFLSSDLFVVDQNSADNELDPLENDFRYSDGASYLGPRQITSVGDCQQGGTVTIAADQKTVVYQPAPDFVGTDRFTYTVDRLMQSTVSVQVIRRVRDDVFRVEADSDAEALPVLINDLFGADYTGAGRITAVTETTAGATATVSDDGQSILYAPPTGFTGEDQLTYTVDGALKAEVTVWVGTTVDDMLSRFDSWADLEEFLLDDALERYEDLFGQECDVRPTGGDFAYDSAVNGAAPDSSESSKSHSETNVQVAGVDEADIIETDGDYLYVLTGGELIIADAWPAREMSIVSRVTIEGELIGEYLHGDRLAVVSRERKELPPPYPSAGWEVDVVDFPCPWPWPWQSDTWVTVYDVSDRGSPAIVQKTKLEGDYVESRRIDDFVFLVLRDSQAGLRLPPPECIPKPDDNGDSSQPTASEEIPGGSYVYETYVYETREQYIERMKAEMGEFIESKLPHYASYDASGELVAEGLLHAPEDLFQPLCPEADSLVTVVSIDMTSDEPGVVATTGIPTTGAGEIYGSLDSLYVFDQQYTWEDGVVTRILKFDWDAEEGEVELAAQGQVAGRMLNQFSADEHQGYLRIATTISNSYSGNWSGRSENVLFVLRDDGGVLELVGSMQNLALGETIRSVRFMGRRAFVTTFRDVDPLLAFDLSDPARPQSCGHITMPGYNSYMQLIDEDHILAVGRNTPIGHSGPTQVALFDIQDLAQPRLIDQYTFERFSTSEAETDHHAFGWFAEHQVLAMPSARVYWERVDEDGDGYRETRRSVREDSLFVFRIDVTATPQSGDGIEPLGEIEHDSPVRRSAFIEQVLYSVAGDSVQAVSILDPADKLAEIRLVTQPLVGTDGDDTFELVVQGPGLWTVKLNGVPVYVGPEVIAVEIDGGGGRDTVILTATSGDDELELSPAHGTLSGDGYRVTIADAESITVHGGGGTDLAKLYDDPQGDETFQVAPTHCILFNDAFTSGAVGFAYVHAYSRGGTDVAKLYDDPQDDETFLVSPGFSTLSNDNFFTRAVGFRYVHAYSSGGTDVGKMYDYPGQVDTLTTTPGYSVLSNDISFNRAFNFAYVHAYSSDSGDVAKLYDDPNRPDTFVATAEAGAMSNGAFFNRAVGFRYVHAYASGDQDLAKLYDDPDADDLFVGKPGDSTLSNGTFANRAVGFPSVHAYSLGGADVAKLYDDTARDDTLVATPEYAVLSNDLWLNRAVGFASTHAYSLGGSDVGKLYDSEQNDRFVGTPEYAALLGDTFSNRAVGFAEVKAYTSAGDDRASLYDSPLEGSPDHLQAAMEPDHTWASVSNELLAYVLTVYDFDEVEATGSNQDDTKDVAVAVDFLVGQGYWSTP